MFFQSTKLKRKAFVLLTMHKGVRSAFEKQLREVLFIKSLSLEQQGEVALFLMFPILKSIEKHTANKSIFTEAIFGVMQLRFKSIKPRA